jgi:hypothetical protein
MPLLLRCGMYFSFAYFAASIVATLLMAFRFETWPMAGRSYSADAALKLAGPMLVVTGTLMGTIGVGFYKRKPWSRILVLVFWIWVPAYVIFVALQGLISWKPAVRPIVQSAILLPVSWWYLYRKADVIEYFRPIN